MIKLIFFFNIIFCITAIQAKIINEKSEEVNSDNSYHHLFSLDNYDIKKKMFDALIKNHDLHQTLYIIRKICSEKPSSVYTNDMPFVHKSFYELKEIIDKSLKISKSGFKASEDLSITINYFTTAERILKCYEDKMNKTILKKCLFDAAANGDVKMTSIFLDSLSRKEELDEPLIQQLFTILQKDKSQELMDVSTNRTSKKPSDLNQIYYNRLCYDSILEATKKMKSNEFNFYQILDFLANRRREIAFHFKIQIHYAEIIDTHFGKRRNLDIFNKKITVTDMKAQYECYSKRVPSDGMKIFGYLRHNNMHIPLTEIYSSFNQKFYQAFIHTKKEHLKDILDEVNMLVIELDSIDHCNIELFCEKIGEIHWWLANGVPWSRGSAAISDMFTKVLFKRYGYQLPRWKIGIMADCEAMIEQDIEAYAQRYISFFKERPSLSIKKTPEELNEDKIQLLQEIRSLSQKANVKEMISTFLLTKP